MKNLLMVAVKVKEAVAVAVTSGARGSNQQRSRCCKSHRERRGSSDGLASCGCVSDCQLLLCSVAIWRLDVSDL